jgi:hypothetical protein
LGEGGERQVGSGESGVVEGGPCIVGGDCIMGSSSRGLG